MVVPIVVSLAAAVVFTWLLFVLVLALRRPPRGVLRESLRLVPDTLRLLRGLASDRSLPRGVRVRLWLLLAYLLSPIDLVPDFVPVIGWADDVIVISVALRSVVKRAGPQTLHDHWPGTLDGLAAIEALCRVREPPREL